MLLKGTGFVAVLAVAGVAAVGCGDDGDTGGSGGSSSAIVSSSTSMMNNATGSGGSGGSPPLVCFDYSTFEAQPDVSFRLDVMPIFAARCNNPNCHGDTANPDAGLYLGELGASNDTSTVAAAVYGELVDVQSQVANNLQRVVPMDAEKSWLMVKLDGELECAQPMCGSLNCGQPMPRGTSAQPLTEQELNLIRSWIQNGAPGPE